MRISGTLGGSETRWLSLVVLCIVLDVGHCGHSISVTVTVSVSVSGRTCRSPYFCMGRIYFCLLVMCDLVSLLFVCVCQNCVSKLCYVSFLAAELSLLTCNSLISDGLRLPKQPCGRSHPVSEYTSSEYVHVPVVECTLRGFYARVEANPKGLMHARAPAPSRPHEIREEPRTRALASPTVQPRTESLADTWRAHPA